MEDGASMESVLSRFPDQAGELRPILRTAQEARERGVPEPSEESIRRGRQRLLQRAAEMRKPRMRAVLPTVQRLGFSLALATIFLLSGTGLVKASSTTIPGDELYPVKRTWEDVRLLFVISPHRQALESEYEQERLDEVAEVLMERRVVSIAFSGLVINSEPGKLTVSGVPVLMSAQTRFSGDPVMVGSAVTVSGQTDTNGQVIAQAVVTLPAGSLVPVGEPEKSDDHKQDSTPEGSSTDTPEVPSGEDTETGHDQRDASGSSFHLDGTIQSIQGNILIVDGRTIYVDPGLAQGTLAVGARVEVNGYFTPDGRFVVTRIEIKQSESEGSSDGSKDDSSHDDGSTDSGDHSGGDTSGGDTGSGED